MRFSDLDGASIGVWGAGRETRSFANALIRHLPTAQIAVVAVDDEPSTDIGGELHAPHARLVTGAEITCALASCDVVVRSPGVSIHRPEMAGIRDAGVQVTTATALWLAERQGQSVIAVTGTKGKSTTASLIAHLARAAGRPAALAGNIGVPALDLLERPADELAVIELSSYQIADLATGAEVVVITNLFREHTDWHGSEQQYHKDKLRILNLPQVRAAVLNGRDARLREAAGSLRSDIALFGQPPGYDVVGDHITVDGRSVAQTTEIPLPGPHNALNVCAAMTALRAYGIAPPALAPALADFSGLPHRLEVVHERGGVTWVNDSISTTPESTIAALDSFPGRNLILLAGGQDRGQDYGELGRMLTQRNVTVLGLPSTGEKLVAAARRAGHSASHAVLAGSLAEAVLQAAAVARPGDVILLSPAAPSYDMYRDYEERGERFRALADRH